MIKIPKNSIVTLFDLRNAIAKCIRTVVDSEVIVHNNWAMTYSIEETMGYLTRNGIVHAWMVSIDSITPEDRKGGSRVGGAALYIPISVKILGFKGYEYGSTRTDACSVMENDCINIVKSLYLNEGDFGDPVLTDNVHDVGLLEFDTIKVRAFGSGNDIIVSEGVIELVWEETIQEA